MKTFFIITGFVTTVYVVLRVLLFVIWLLYVAGRDTMRTLRNAELREGWSRLWWPYCYARGFFSECGEHLKAWSNGWTREVTSSHSIGDDQ